MRRRGAGRRKALYRDQLLRNIFANFIEFSEYVFQRALGGRLPGPAPGAGDGGEEGQEEDEEGGRHQEVGGRLNKNKTKNQDRK